MTTMDSLVGAPPAIERGEQPLVYARTVQRQRLGSASSLTISLVALGITLVTMPDLHDAAYHPYGLLAAAPLAYVIAIVLGPLAFAAAIAAHARGAAWVALGSSVLVMRLPLALATDLPLYSWTYKHFGVVDYIQTFGTVAHGVDIYHSWPGVFAGVAWINDLTGVETVDVAHWFTPLFQVALTGAIYVCARCFGLSREASLVAAFVGHLVNWVAQDYFSPQAVALLLGVAVLALLGRSRRSPAASWIALAIFAAITVSHQLTPYWLVAIVAAFAVLRWVRPRWIVVLFVAVVVGYLALNYDIVARYGSLLQFDVLSNANTNVEGAGSPGHALSSLAGRATTAALWVGTAAVWIVSVIRQKRTRRRMLALGALAFASFALLAGQSYGGEAIFRVMLYSIVGCALILAPLLTRALQSGIGGRVRARRRLGPSRRFGWIAQTAAVIALSVTALASAEANFGGWFANRVSKDSYVGATEILLTADPHTLMIGLAPGAPGRTVARYTEFATINGAFDYGVNNWYGWLGYDFRSDEKVTKMTDDLVAADQPAVVFITDQMKIYSDYYGMFPPGSIDRYEEQLRENPHWRLAEETPTLTFFELELGDDD
ncbi:hypothetical protein [Homoserinibacter sp. GY 40078]|uniref:hypothetical protein n=1 Tax=Homoserinibacter sp. GY 40078 TaxID=2603275 RepID=UPI0011C79275|nr:hypothetical protein [Homoserinibacter sp. GY 40078]TXK17098.1 hypothetical protein FVQ89_09480 [Homoserinibacter sp. GY 40078]